MIVVSGTFLAGCTPDETTSLVDSDTNRTEGLALALREADGQPESEATTYLGGTQPAHADGAGFIYYLDVTPGRVPVLVRRDGFASGYLGPLAQTGALVGGSVDLLPLNIFPVSDPEDSTTVSDGTITITVPPDAVETRDGPVAGAWEIGMARAFDPEAGPTGGPRRWSVPSDLLVLHNDVEFQPAVFQHVTVGRGWQGDEEVFLVDGATVHVTVALEDDSPLLAPSVVPALFTYSSGKAYWIEAAQVTVDRDAQIASFDAPSLGWWALGHVGFAQSCVRGRVADRFVSDLLGAQVALAEDGTIGVDRRTTTEEGFCMPIGAGARADLRILGFDVGRTALYTWTGEVTGGDPGSCDEPSSCVDLGLITPDVYEDEDGDLAYAGSGGDCNDADPSINPNRATGDGTYCGGSLW